VTGRNFGGRVLLTTAENAWRGSQANLVDVYVGYLRRKIGEPMIETVRGAGCRLRIGDLRPSGRLATCQDQPSQ
jgi:DNA-binding response OmpR family regulator